MKATGRGPGRASGRGRGRGRGRDGEDSGHDYDDDEEESDDEPAMPVEEPTQFRGQFRCQLCPNKILLNEKLMEQHLKSTLHKKNVKRFEHAKEIGVAAFEDECRARAEARRAAKTGTSKRKQKVAEYWAHRLEKGRRKRPGSEKAKDLTPRQIEERKQHFQEKKARRREAAATKGDAGAGAAVVEQASAAEAPVERPRKKKQRPDTEVCGNPSTGHRSAGTKSAAPVAGASADAEGGGGKAPHRERRKDRKL